MIHYILARIDTGNRSASEIIKDVTILKVIECIQTSWVELSKNTVKDCFEKFDKPGFGKTDVVADETVDNEFDGLLQELCSDATVKEFLKFDDSFDTCEPLVNTLPGDWGQELTAECIQSVINPKVKSDDDGSDLEEDVNDAMEINSKPAVNSGEALAI